MTMHGKRVRGELYILSTANKELHKARYYGDKRFSYQRIYLSKPGANRAADANRKRGFLARVLPRMVWVNRAGYEAGVSKVQGYVLYVHIPGPWVGRCLK